MIIQVKKKHVNPENIRNYVLFVLSCDYKIDDIKNNDLTSFFADQYIGYEENIIVFELKCSNFNGVFIFLIKFDFLVNFLMYINSVLNLYRVNKPPIKIAISNKFIYSVYSINSFNSHYYAKSKTYTVFRI